MRAGPLALRARFAMLRAPCAHLVFPLPVTLRGHREDPAVHRTAWAVVPALVLAAVLVVGCAPPDDQAEPAATASPTATSPPERTPSASPTPTGVRTGVSSMLDAIVQATLAGDAARL